MWAEVDPPNRICLDDVDEQRYRRSLLYDATRTGTRSFADLRANGGERRALTYRFNWETPIAFVCGPLDASPQPPRVLVGGNVVFASAIAGGTGTQSAPTSRATTSRISKHPAAQSIRTCPAPKFGHDPRRRNHELANRCWVGTDDGLVAALARLGRALEQRYAARHCGVGPDRIEPGHASDDRLRFRRPASSRRRPSVSLRDRRRRSDLDLDRRRPAAGSFRARRPRGSNELEPVVCRNESRYLRDVRSRPPLALAAPNMPATAIYDMQIAQPNDDLVVASHGRGVWILDDLRALEALAAATPSSVTLFAPRTAVREWRWAPVNSFPCCTGNASGKRVRRRDAPYGALFTYYLPQKLAAAPNDRYRRCKRANDPASRRRRRSERCGPELLDVGSRRKRTGKVDERQPAMERRRGGRRGSRPRHLHGATARRRENLRTQRHRRGRSACADFRASGAGRATTFSPRFSTNSAASTVGSRARQGFVYRERRAAHGAPRLRPGAQRNDPGATSRT